jgi:hypothetical protein
MSTSSTAAEDTRAPRRPSTSRACSRSTYCLRRPCRLPAWRCACDHAKRSTEEHARTYS